MPFVGAYHRHGDSTCALSAETMVLLAYMALLVPSVPHKALIVVGARSRAAPECDGPQISLRLTKGADSMSCQTLAAGKRLHFANGTSALHAHDQASGLGHHGLNGLRDSFLEDDSCSKQLLHRENRFGSRSEVDAQTGTTLHNPPNGTGV